MRNKQIGSLLKLLDGIPVNFYELLKDTFFLGLNHILFAGNGNSLNFDLSQVFNAVQKVLVFPIKKSDASAVLALSGSSTRSVDVGLRVFGRLHLDNEFDVGDVEATGCYISCNQDLELVVPESFECDFPLILGNIAMHSLDFVLDLI